MTNDSDHRNISRYLAFQLKGETYGFCIGSVQEINRMMEVTPLPKASKSLVGVMNLRGKVIPVVDLALQLQMESSKQTKRTSIVVTESQWGVIGVVVDAVKSVVEISSAQIEALSDFTTSADKRFIMGLAKTETEVIILLDIVEVLGKQPPHSSVEFRAGGL